MSPIRSRWKLHQHRRRREVSPPPCPGSAPIFPPRGCGLAQSPEPSEEESRPQGSCSSPNSRALWKLGVHVPVSHVALSPLPLPKQLFPLARGPQRSRPGKDDRRRMKALAGSTVVAQQVKGPRAARDQQPLITSVSPHPVSCETPSSTPPLHCLGWPLAVSGDNATRLQAGSRVPGSPQSARCCAAGACRGLSPQGHSPVPSRVAPGRTRSRTRTLTRGCKCNLQVYECVGDLGTSRRLSFTLAK